MWDLEQKIKRQKEPGGSSSSIKRHCIRTLPNQETNARRGKNGLFELRGGEKGFE